MRSEVVLRDQDDLLALDMWVRIMVKLFSDDSIMLYYLAFLSDVIIDLVLLMQNVEKSAKANRELQQATASIVLANLQVGLLEAIYLLCDYEQIRVLLFHSSIFSSWMIEQLTQVKKALRLRAKQCRFPRRCAKKY